MIVTPATAKLGTLAAMRFWMPAICDGSSERPGYRLSSTEAEGFCSSRTKTVGFWNCQMHARLLNGADRLNRPGQFAFKPALVIHLLGKLADAEFLVFHELEADAAALGKSLCGKAQTRFMDAGAGHQE